MVLSSGGKTMFYIPWMVDRWQQNHERTLTYSMNGDFHFAGTAKLV
jgi:hypothetical protein